METASAFQKARAVYEEIYREYLDGLAAQGIRFAEAHDDETRNATLREALRERGASFRNGGASISTDWLSRACEACTGGAAAPSETFYTSLSCHRDCYFCFNKNQHDYEFYCEHDYPWEEALAAAARRGRLDCIGLTGGEPLLHPDSTCAFLERAADLHPEAHTRLYTSGDLLDAALAARLADHGLDEMRFSVKVDDAPDRQRRVLEAMALASEYIPDVVVEMPVIPGTGNAMKELMRQFDLVGIRGMNLLEFCYPLHNWDAFAQRGLCIKNPPFPVLYDYGYAGGLPVAGSEELCLALMVHGLDAGYTFGMHYCSLENKHRSEMRLRNECGRNAHPCYEFDEHDFFLKTVKVFGDDCALAQAVLDGAGCSYSVEDEDEQSLSFPPRYGGVVAASGILVADSYNVFEIREGEYVLREVALKERVC